ncbi:MAG: phage tail protein [Clostridiales bacterium]|nr:phage tail protein [Clostridiales bacterium]
MRNDPYLNYRFLIEIDGIVQAGFSECSGLSSKIDVVQYREGGDLGNVRKLPGQANYPDITLKWGLTDSSEMYDWHLNAINGMTERKNCSIIVLGDDKEEVVRWNIYDAWPNAWTGPTLNAKGSDVAIEQMTLTCERVERGR